MNLGTREQSGTENAAPRAVQEPIEHVIHGDRRQDLYAWLKDRDDPRVKQYLEAENAYAEAWMRPLEGLQEKLYQEMLGRIQQTDMSVPYVLRGYEYYSRTEEGKQYPIYCRKKRPTGRHGSREVEETSVQTQQSPSAELRQPRVQAAGSIERNSPSDVAARAGQNDPSQGPVPDEGVLLDLNQLAIGHTYMGLGIFEVSDDNQRLAYATDQTGYRQYTLEVKNLQSGALLPFRVERVTSAAWSVDNRTLFYVTEDEVTKRSNQLWRAAVGEESPGSVDRLASSAEEGTECSPGEHGGKREDSGESGAPGLGPAARELLYEEKDERFRIDVERSRSGAYLFLHASSHTTTEVRYLRAAAPWGEFELIAPREDEHEYYADHHPGSATDPADGVFFIRTNSGGRTFRLVTAPAADPRRSRWHEVVPNRAKVMLAGVAAFRTHLILYEREDGLPYLRIVDLTRPAPTALAASKRIAFAEPAYDARLGENPAFDTAHVRFQYESLVTPRSVYDYHLRTGKSELRKQQVVLGDFDAGNYVSERLHASAKDGTLVPISVVRRKNTLRDGEAALLLYGYGSYGLSMPVNFSSNRLSLLDRGMIYAIAHIRGGGELGKSWHDDGRMHKKMNTFTDFIACAEYLVAKRYTSAERLVIEGGSAGGLLMGAVTNLAPQLFHAVVSRVPFVDVLNTMLDSTLPLTVGEYEEWGNPALSEDYFYMKQYCPYSNLEPKAYPQMLVKTALNDSQVMYWEPAKYVAKMRTMKTDGNVLLLVTNMGAGHGGASGRYDYLREIALDYAFLLGGLGVKE